jgi:antitoxin MazE
MQVAKWGNSLAVRLPRKLVESLGLKPGDRLEIVDSETRRLTVSKADTARQALSRMERRAWTIPEDFRFDREEANQR